jgi:transposase
MMGEKVRHFAEHPAIALEALVPPQHFYRHLERALDLAFVRDLVRDCYAAGGRPSIDPVVFFRLQLVMFFEGIRSERQLMRVVADRLSLRWYIGYDLDEALPDHSSLTKIRERYGVEVFRRFFDAVVARCRQAGLVWGEELYLDATQVDANAARDSLTPRFAVEAHLANLFPPAEPDGAASPADSPPDPAPAEEAGPAAPVRLPVALAGDASAALAEENTRRHDWLAEVGRQRREVTRGSYRRKADYQVSTTDADATAMRRKGGGVHLGYHTHYVVDGGKARIILRALVTPAEVMENQPALDLLWQACFRWRLRPHLVAADTTYGTGEIIRAIEEAGIRAYLPLPENDQRTPLFSKRDFTYDPERDVYLCPQGTALRFAAVSPAERLRVYYADRAACNACPIKARCTTTDQGRRVSRHMDEEYVDLARSYHETEPYRKARRKRQVWVEPLFAEAKEWHGLRRFRLRGLERVNREALLVAAGQNLKRLLSCRGWGRRPWPGGAAGLALAPVAAATGITQ